MLFCFTGYNSRYTSVVCALEFGAFLASWFSPLVTKFVLLADHSNTCTSQSTTQLSFLFAKRVIPVRECLGQNLGGLLETLFASDGAILILESKI